MQTKQNKYKQIKTTAIRQKQRKPATPKTIKQIKAKQTSNN